MNTVLSASPVFGKSVVQRTPELTRIALLPRRTWTDEEAKELARRMTRELRTPNGDMQLFPAQAVALYEAMECGGLFGPIKVGGGKTLLSFLLAVVLEAKRPVLLLPAALVEKTRQERGALAVHWRLPTNLQIVSYEMMGRVSCAEKLTYIKPDLLIADEAHRLKNKRAGVTRRVARYMKDFPETGFAGISGTVMKSSLEDFAHILRWALKDGAPVPKTDDEVSSWAAALDETSNPLARARPGALFDLGARPSQADAPDALSAARQIFQKRLLETRGVVASGRVDEVACSLYIRALPYKPSPVTEEHLHVLRSTWATPDGVEFSTAVEKWRHARTLALGFHAIWDPPAPAEWLSARREWTSFAREAISNSRSHALDTELQVAQAVDAGRLPGAALHAWRAIRSTFTVNPKDVWHDDSALKAAADWMRESKHDGIVWTSHVFFAKALAKLTGAPYYGAHGIDARTGADIANVALEDGPIICSLEANATGRNLQMFSKNLVTSPPESALRWEQMLGRTHRYGQKADEVFVDVMMGCQEQVDAVEKALEEAKAHADTLGHDQKLLLADKSF